MTFDEEEPFEWLFSLNNTVSKHLLWRNHSDECTAIQHFMPVKTDMPIIQIIFSILYFIVWLSALTGNLCVIYVVTLKQVTLSSVRSVFICSLAVSDIVMCLTSLPITAISIFTRDWVFPTIWCIFSGVFQGGGIFVSSFTMTAIALDRFILIKWPAVEIIDFKKAILMVIFIWILGYGCALPAGIFSNAVAYTPLCGHFCEENWPDSVSDHDDQSASMLRRVYGSTVLIVQFGVPVVISSICYIGIGRIISNQVRKRRKHETLLIDNKQRLENRRNRSHRMMVFMVGGLVLAWLPMNLINVYRDFTDVAISNQWYSVVFAACHVTAMTSAVWNPIIYSWFNPQFRTTVRTAFRSKRRYGTFSEMSPQTQTAQK